MATAGFSIILNAYNLPFGTCFQYLFTTFFPLQVNFLDIFIIEVIVSALKLNWWNFPQWSFAEFAEQKIYWSQRFYNSPTKLLEGIGMPHPHGNRCSREQTPSPWKEHGIRQEVPSYHPHLLLTSSGNHQSGRSASYCNAYLLNWSNGLFIAVFLPLQQIY